MPALGGINYERRGSGEPLLLIHGIGSRWEVWLPVIEHLAAHHDVIAVDLPGFGGSPRPPAGTAPGIPFFADRLTAFLHQLEIARPHVAGNSMGGWVGLELARREAATTVCALSPAGFLSFADRFRTIPLLAGERVIVRALHPVLGSALKTELGRKLGLGVVCAHPERVQPDFAVQNTDGLAEATWFWPNLRALTLEDCAPARPDLPVPVTIAWGAKDRLLPPSQAATARARFASAHVVSLPDCGHIPMWDNPALVSEVILKTTRRTVAPAAAGA